jgi:VanZ family protein
VKLPRILRPLPWATAALAIYWCALFIATHVPKLPRVGAPVNTDKVAHFLGYTLLSFLAAAALLRWRWSRGAAGKILAVVILYGVVDELLQKAIPGRSADLWDWLCDCAGAVVGMLAFRVMQKTLLQRREAREVALERV